MKQKHIMSQGTYTRLVILVEIELHNQTKDHNQKKKKISMTHYTLCQNEELAQTQLRPGASRGTLTQANTDLNIFSRKEF
jgi:hypothetical protein